MSMMRYLPMFAVLALAAPAGHAQYSPGYGNPGYGNGGGQHFVCESRKNRQNWCQTDGGRVRLYRQLSGSACDEGRTWGQDRRGVWVTGGCRAEFVTTRWRGGWRDRDDDNRGNNGGYGGGGQRFRCESGNGRQNFCNVDTRWGVRITRQLSDSACIEGRTWGTARDGVWVSGGCRAEFVTGR